MKNKSCHSRRTKIVRRSKKNLRRTIKRKRLGKGRRRPTRRYSRVQRGGGISKADLKLLIDNAQDGRADAQFALGNMYELGRGVDKNEAEAARLYNLAAEQGYADAQFALGNMYEEGRGVDKNEAQAVILYKLAAAQGHEDAEFALGNMYEDGRGVEKKDDAEAARLYKLAAEQFHAGAHFALGKMYEDGRVFEKNVNEAYTLYLKAGKLILGEQKQQDDLIDRLRKIRNPIDENAQKNGKPLTKEDALKIEREVNIWWKALKEQWRLLSIQNTKPND